MIRRLVVVVAVLAASAVGIGLAGLYGRGAALVGAETRLLTGQAAKLESAGVGIDFPPGVRLGQVRLVGQDVWKGSVFATARALHLEPSWTALLTARARVAGVRIEAPSLLAVPALESPLLGLPHLAFGAGVPVRLAGARLEVVDDWAKPSRQTLLGPFDLTVLPAGDTVRFDLAGALLGENSKARLSGTLAPGAGPSGGTAVDAKWSLERGDSSLFGQIVPQLAGVLGGSLSVEGEASGFVGEKTTEIAPAAPLEITAKGSAELALLGHTAPLSVEAEGSLDDVRLALKKAKCRWGTIPLEAAGWLRHRAPTKFSVRVEAESLELRPALAELGVPEEWRMDASVSGRARIFSAGDQVLYRYEARAPHVEWHTPLGWPLEADDVKVTGTFLSVNADVSASFEARTLKLGKAWFERVRFGGKYWKNELHASTVDLELWDGKVTVSGAYYPREGGRMVGAATIDDVRADKALHSLWPDAPIDVEGRLDALVEAGRDEGAAWLNGRVGVHYGKLIGVGLARTVLEAIGRYARHRRLLDPALVAAHADVLSERRLGFERLRFDVQTRGSEVLLRGIVATSRDAVIRAEGAIGEDGHFAGWGTLTLEPQLTGRLADRLPELRALRGGDGRLRIPFHVRVGPDGEVAAEPDDAFLAAIDRVTRGEQVPPFVPVSPEESAEMDLPTLEEQFGR